MSKSSKITAGIVPGSRIEQLRKRLKMTQAEFGKQIVKSETTVRNWETGATEPPEGIENLLSSLFDANPRWLLTGQGDILLTKFELPTSNLVPVTIHNSAGIGPGRDDNEQEVHPRPIEIKMFPEELVNGYRNGFRVAGDSMEPTLSEDDYVGVDFDDKLFIDGKMYLIHRAYEGYSVKRLEDHPDGILIRSDSPLVTDKLITRDKIEHDFKIIGSIAWIFGKRKKDKLKPDKK